MPTYKYNPAATASRQVININGKVYYAGDSFETNLYYSDNFMDEMDLEFVSDGPTFISPLIASTGKVSGNSSLTIPDSNWGFNMYAEIPSNVKLTITFNGSTETKDTIYITNSGMFARNVSGRAIRTLTITAEGSGNYCVYCMRCEQSRYPDTYGM